MTIDESRVATTAMPGRMPAAREPTGERAVGPVLPVVGIGASAGGLRATIDLLAAIPPDIGMAFVLIQHLDPTHRSILPELLTRATRLTVEVAIDGRTVEANRVYVIAPGTTLRIEGGILRVTAREDGKGPHLTVDAFLRSLADDRQGAAIAIILSGTGSDGTLGVAAVKAAGGITFAQDESAEHASMPRNAAGDGHVDFVLAPASIAERLVGLARSGAPWDAPVVDASSSRATEPDLAAVDIPDVYTAILRRLRVATGVDFTHYRPTTITRRIHRRMALHGTATLVEYARRLVDEPAEVEALAGDILIHVTSFFRDPQAFRLLETAVIPALLRARPVADAIRIWVVGCSTGQEAYSIAIAVVEHLESARVDAPVQIFATDISEQALAKARTGWYPEGIRDVIAPERLARFFVPDGAGYRVVKRVRDLCIFAKHDVTAEVPFSRMGLITCRNVLIYLGPPLQKRVLQTFHFSLASGGFLLLGTSESIDRAAGDFDTVDEKLRLFRRRQSKTRFSVSVATAQSPRPPSTPPMSTPSHDAPPPIDLMRAVDQILLKRFRHAAVLVSPTLEILQFRGDTASFLEPAQGEATLDLLRMVPFALARELREAVAEAAEHGRSVRREHLALRRGETRRSIGVEVIPVGARSATPSFLVLFEDEAAAPAAGAPVPVAAGTPADQHELAELRFELAAIADHVRSLEEHNRNLVEQLAVAQEETQSASEEFRSTNEELQTAKEEVESTNEELVTINDELHAANADLAKALEALRASGDLTAAIVDTMRYPLLVLDADLRVESANQSFLDTFRVGRHETIGRLVYQLGDGQWDIPELRRLLENVLPQRAAFDDFEVTHEFLNVGKRTMLLNARRLVGERRAPRIVLVIADVTERAKMTEDVTHASRELMRSNAELDQFAAVASHDLQEPLRMMSSYIALLQRQYADRFDDRAREYMAFVTDGAKRMTEMVKGILDYSRLGHEVADVAMIDSGEAFLDATANLKRKIREVHASVEAETLPRLRANREQLAQVFQNLIGNALKFRSPDRPLRVRVSATRTDDGWTFAVADNGIGLAKTDYERVFQLFGRVQGERKVAGTGIGLATCKKIVEHHRGRIWVESEVGEGSTFRFSIPARTA